MGAVVAGLRDLSFEPYAYGLVFLANLATAIYLATIARLGTATFPGYVCTQYRTVLVRSATIVAVYVLY